MAVRTTGLQAGLMLPLLLAIAAPISAQVPKDVAEFERQNQQAWKETNAAGKPSPQATHPGATHPGKKWAGVFWSYRQKADAAIATRATAEAIHLLIHAGRPDEAIARAESLALDDPAWVRVLDILFEAAEQRKDYSFIIKKSGDLFAKAPARDSRAAAASARGTALWKSGRLDEAVAAFRQVIQTAPDSDRAKSAEGNIYELTHLQAGQPGPPFTATTLSGAAIDSARLRGKVVLLNFWASY